LSNIIKNIIEAPIISIGEKHLDFVLEKKAQSKLGIMFPVVSVITDSDGARFIPIQEIFQIEKVYQDEIVKSQKDGYETGYEAGVKKGLENAEEVLRQLDGAIKDAIVQREALFEEARDKVLELVVKISKKVTYDAIDIDPEIVVKMINGVIDSLVDRTTIKIKVNPKHLAIVEQNIDSFLKNSTMIKELSIESDPRVQYGGCFIETPTGDIDARLNSQFEVIEDALLSGEEETG
jgi:flagellar assembly protein FliH